MILIGIGGNLASKFGSPLESMTHAVSLFAGHDMRVRACSPWYGSRAQPISGQPDFVNGVIQIETVLNPLQLLSALQELEKRFDRVRGEKNAARTLDLDVLAYEDCSGNFAAPGGPELMLPHPRMHERDFVLAPLCDIAPEWRHPRLLRTAAELLAALPVPHAVWRL